MGANTKYKDSVFSLLFSDADILRELYCALEDISLPIDIPITINTLRDVLFMDKVNDISFVIGGKLVILIEHQSSVNPNMALRLLIYIARIYEKIIGDKNIYSSKLIRIPQPEFFVLYNGVSPYPDAEVLKLSDAFEKRETLGIPEKEIPVLELAVKVININEGRNESIAKRCETLGGYTRFIGKVREYEKESGSLEEGIRRAIKYCREHNVLREFLEENGTEVINMLMTEWNWDDALAVRYEEGREERQDEIARNLLVEGVSIDIIEKTTGLDIDAIKKLQET
jgi:predicted transposase/invertase (TIGR01784 family)